MITIRQIEALIDGYIDIIAIRPNESIPAGINLDIFKHKRFTVSEDYYLDIYALTLSTLERIDITNNIQIGEMIGIPHSALIDFPIIQDRVDNNKSIYWIMGMVKAYCELQVVDVRFDDLVNYLVREENLEESLNDCYDRFGDYTDTSNINIRKLYCPDNPIKAYPIP